MRIMLFVSLLTAILMVLEWDCLAQDDLIISGIVLDAETLAPLPYTHIMRNLRSATTPDQSGAFLIGVSPLDTLTISHVSYISTSLLIQKTENSDTLVVSIFLEREINILPELQVSPYPATLRDFKQSVLEVEVIDPLMSFRRQQPAITYDIIMGPKVSYDAYENYRRINQPTEFTLFSTDPNRGIRKLLKRLKGR